LKHYVIYKTINTVNNKYYIGKHATNSLDDGYLGSGKLLSLAVKKYGKDNFLREILYTFNTLDELNSKEREIITEDVINDKNSYNITLGGQGGNLGPVVNEKIGKTMSKILTGKSKSKKHKDAISESTIGHDVTNETRKKIGNSVSQLMKQMDEHTRRTVYGRSNELNAFYKKEHTQESINKMKSTIGDSRKGAKNPRAVPITFRGKTFGCKKDCAEYFNLTKYQLARILGEKNG